MIDEKLTILLENDIIDDQIFKEMQDVIDYLKTSGVIINGDEVDVFITHLAMASARVKNQEDPIESVEDVVKSQIREAAEFEDAIKLWERVSEIVSIDFPIAENDYFYLHLVTLLQNKN